MNPETPMTTATGSTPQIVKTKQKWSIKKKLAVIFGSIVGLIAIIIAIAMLATSAPLEVSDKFISGIQSGDAEAAYNLMTDAAKEATDPSDFIAMVESVGPILNGKPKVTSRQASTDTDTGSNSEIVYEIAGSDSRTYEITVNLVVENNKWKVLNFESKAKE